MALTDKLTNIAEAIRAETGGTESLTLDEMAESVSSIGATLIGFIERTLTEYSNSSIQKIGDGAFMGFSSLKTVDLPEVTRLGQYAFQNSGIETICLPKLTTVGLNRVFSGCGNLKSASFPLLTRTNDFAFSGCGKLENLHLPTATRIDYYGCASCSKLARIDLPKVTFISNNAFSDSKSFATLILRSETMCALNSTSAFSATLISSGTGYIYVPRALLSDDDETKDYRRATNWVMYANRFRAIEDYPEICGEVSA